MTVRKFFEVSSLILIPIFIALAVIGAYERYLDGKIESLYNPMLAKTYGVDEMNKGLKLLQRNAEKDDLIILGSSELDSGVPENPKNMFPNTELDCNVDLVGRAYAQNMANAIRVGALGDSLKGKKVVLIISLQWFLGDDINLNGFRAHFSEIQFYKFMNNDKISRESKLYLCDRVTKLLKNDSIFERPYLYAKLYKSDSVFSKALMTFFKPYFYLRERFLVLRDKCQAYKAVKRFKDCPQNVIGTLDIDWGKEEQKAQKLGEEACTNNDYYVMDDYYDKYLKEWLKTSKNSVDESFDLRNSKEFDDYKLMLEAFSSCGAKPYIVFMSTNGLYYDYTGLNKEKRDAFYDKLGKMARDYSIPYLDLREKEYEPYFYKDVMHLGWKGWLYVNKQISQHYSKG